MGLRQLANEGSRTRRIDSMPKKMATHPPSVASAIWPVHRRVAAIFNEPMPRTEREGGGLADDHLGANRLFPCWQLLPCSSRNSFCLHHDFFFYPSIGRVMAILSVCVSSNNNNCVQVCVKYLYVQQELSVLVVMVSCRLDSLEIQPQDSTSRLCV